MPVQPKDGKEEGKCQRVQDPTGRHAREAGRGHRVYQHQADRV